MQRGLIVAAVVGVLAAVAGLWRNSTQSTQAKGEPGSSAQELAQLRSEVRALEREMREVPARAAIAARSAEQAQPSSRGSAAPAQEPASARPARDTDEVVREVATNCDARLATEPRDPSWSRATETAIHDTVGRLGPKTRVLSSDCASTVCRTVLESESPADEQTLLSAIAAEAPFAWGTLYQYDRSGARPRATLYVAREGHRLDPENAPQAAAGTTDDPPAIPN